MGERTIGLIPRQQDGATVVAADPYVGAALAHPAQAGAGDRQAVRFRVPRTSIGTTLAAALVTVVVLTAVVLWNVLRDPPAARRSRR